MACASNGPQQRLQEGQSPPGRAAARGRAEEPQRDRSKMPSTAVPEHLWVWGPAQPGGLDLSILPRLRRSNKSPLGFAHPVSVGNGKACSASSLLRSKSCSLSRTSGALPAHLLVSV